MEKELNGKLGDIPISVDVAESNSVCYNSNEAKAAAKQLFKSMMVSTI